ncbi:MAG TPA: hypothetical protein PLV68_08905, partial [Ilumatobacteraceae bacterium]|nr:hypothetical protein [Ilumatobacteraceae bacterium]
VMDRLDQITTPVLFLAGSADRADYANSGEYLSRKMPACRFMLIDQGEHSMHESQPDVVAAAIREFAGGLASAT